MAGFKTAFSWWIAGIPWDIIHCCGNFILMLVLFSPVKSVIVNRLQIIDKTFDMGIKRF